MKREYVKMRKNDIITGANSMMMIIQEPRGTKQKLRKKLSVFLQYALILNNQKYPQIGRQCIMHETSTVDQNHSYETSQFSQTNLYLLSNSIFFWGEILIPYLKRNATGNNNASFKHTQCGQLIIDFSLTNLSPE